MRTLIALFLVTAATTAAAADGCGGSDSCVETRSFVANVSNFRISKSGQQRLLTVTLTVRNTTAAPLMLGYVSDSAVAIDDNGNRYVVERPQSVRGMGVIAGSNVDAKFTLPPGESGDARFELAWNAADAEPGSAFELDLAIREIAAAGADSYKLGAEHSVHFARLTENTAATAPPDPCGGSPACYNAGVFIAEIAQVTPSAMARGVRHHTVAINVRFRNVSDRPIILGYESGSSAGTDNFGNTYYWGRPGTHDTSAKGIGLVTGRSADTQFGLNPGQSRNATFTLVRYNAVAPIGDAWTYDVVIDELEILPGQQVRTLRQNSLNFRNVSAATTFTGTAANAEETANKVIDLFKKLGN